MSECLKRPLEEDASSVEPEKKRKPLTLAQQNMKKFGIEIPHIYTNEDMKKAPWTDIARKLYREKKTLHDSKQASKWMRWWFEEHEDLPAPPKAGPRSAYFIYTQQKCTELNIFNNKKEIKKLGAAWKAMSEEDQEPWAKLLEEKRKEHEKDEAQYEDDLAAWRKKKKEKPERTDDKPSCSCIYCLGEHTSGVRMPDIF